jgi:hypothetical protein
MDDTDSELAMVAGEFFSDGKTFVFRLAGTPLTGIGETPSAAFEDLMRVDAKTAPLSALMRERARDQQGEITRAAIIRMTMIGLIIFAVLGGAIVATAAIAPRVAVDVGGLALTRLVHSLDDMSPQHQAELTRAANRINELFGRQNAALGCANDGKARLP